MMEIKKCTQCGAPLERLRIRREWFCPFCGVRYTDPAQAEEHAPAEYFGLNEEVFVLEGDLAKVMKDDGGAGCIRSLAHCMNIFENAAEVESYLLKKISCPDDISLKGVREDQIDRAMPLLQTVMEPDERVIVYGNKGIFSKGKEYFTVTDRQSIFVEKKKVKSVLHADLDSLKIEPCGNCCVNTDYEKGFVNLDGNGRFQGALLALICMLSFEADPGRGRIRILAP